MRIIQYMSALRLNGGGPVRAIIDLSGALARAGHESVVATYDDEAWPADWPRVSLPSASPAVATEAWDRASRSSGLPLLWKLPPPAWPLGVFSPAQMRELRGLISRSQAVHVHGVWERSNAQIASIARSLHIPYVVSLRGMLDVWSMSQHGLRKRLYLSVAGRKMLEEAAIVHCTAQSELEQAQKWFPAGHGVVVPNLLELRAYADLPGPEAARAKFPLLNRGRPNVLFLSRVHYKKGVEVLLEAAGLLRDSGTDVNILIAGDGDSAYVAGLRSQVEKKRLTDRVEFLGLVGSPLKESLYQACQVFALPTSQENFGFVFYEALACGLPVVTTFQVDTWSELKASGGAVIVNRDARAFADSIRTLLDDDAKRAAMGRAGRGWVFENLETDKVLGLFERTYERAIGGNPDARTPSGRRSVGKHGLVSQRG